MIQVNSRIQLQRRGNGCRVAERFTGFPDPALVTVLVKKPDVQWELCHSEDTLTSLLPWTSTTLAQLLCTESRFCATQNRGLTMGPPPKSPSVLMFPADKWPLFIPCWTLTGLILHGLRGEIVFVQRGGNGEEMRRGASLAEILISLGVR